MVLEKLVGCIDAGQWKNALKYFVRGVRVGVCNAVCVGATRVHRLVEFRDLLRLNSTVREMRKRGLSLFDGGVAR